MAKTQGIDGDSGSVCVGSAMFDALGGGIRGPSPAI
jgi:hypothetical protein